MISYYLALSQYNDMARLLVMILTFESVDKILWCYHSNQTSVAELLHCTFYSQKKFEFLVICSGLYQESRVNTIKWPLSGKRCK